MAETDNPDAPIVAPRATRFGEGPEGKVARRERGHSGQQSGPVGRIGNFLHDVRAELKRVSWPTLQHVQNTTLITLVAVAFFAAYLFAVDQTLARAIIPALDWLITKIIGLVGLA
ncbi:MAG TPA: preprotein translocase subunit SecE [Pyrinomonadaceae bacterium]|nr:preprotein translocase subunit SecE [Pyrinomonadaceae bacterium]